MTTLSIIRIEFVELAPALECQMRALKNKRQQTLKCVVKVVCVCVRATHVNEETAEVTTASKHTTGVKVQTHNLIPCINSYCKISQYFHRIP